MGKIKTGIARTFTRYDQRDHLGSPYDTRGGFEIHGVFGSFFNKWTHFHPFKKTVAVYETTYDRSEEIPGKDGYSWDRRYIFWRGDKNIMEEVRRVLKGYVYVRFIAYEKQLTNALGERIMAPGTKYVHTVRMEFTDKNDALMLKMILA